MTVKNAPPGQRSIELEVEVPGTPEQVWQAIATGPGISCWFVPTEVEEREGGAILFHLGPGMDSPATVTAWEPLRRFAYEEVDWAPNAPPLATELTVETRSGGTCVVRLVHSLFTASDAWDDQLQGFEVGWPPFFHVLRLYLREFWGRPCSPVRLMGKGAGSEPAAWGALTAALGLAGAKPGERRSTPAASAPPLAGVVEPRGEGRHAHELVLLLDEPTPGVALLGAYTWDGSVHVLVNLYLFGDQALDTAAHDEPLWQAWMQEHFPAAGDANPVA